MALTKETKDKLVKEFGLHGNDTGSMDTQVAMLTHNINELTGHCQKHKHDFSTRRGLLKMVCRRRTFLKIIKKDNEEKYRDLISRLGLRK